ncbi:hypothetical protein ABBQ38_015177 [Trebouxia sp. C0009 RCD-2024]
MFPGLSLYCMQRLPKWGTKRLSFGYKLRSPGDAVLNQYASLAASGKQLDDKYMKEMTVSALMEILHETHTSINNSRAEMAQMGLSSEWQRAITKWRASRHAVNDNWIWNNLISTMNGWERPNQTIFFRTLQLQIFRLRVHPTWKLVGIESLLEVVHGMPPPGIVRFVRGGQLINIDSGQRLSQTAMQDGSMIWIALKMRGD